MCLGVTPLMSAFNLTESVKWTKCDIFQKTGTKQLQFKYKEQKIKITKK